jgi:6-pyruvoyltetrahydropterin/6-carboxytetrahydropterin synthase
MRYVSTKIIPMGSTAFRQWRADSHCKLIHGYRLQCKLWFTSDELDDKNWVFDFGGCRVIKGILEKQFDHTTVVAADDPELGTFEMMSDKGMIDLRIAEKGVGIERTAEWVYDNTNSYVKDITNGRVRVIKVEVWEHEGNSAIYEESENTSAEVHVAESAIATNVAAVIGNSVVDIPQATPVETPKKPVSVLEKKPKLTPGLYSRKSSGLSNPFAGTSWGN